MKTIDFRMTWSSLKQEAGSATSAYKLMYDNLSGDMKKLLLEPKKLFDDSAKRNDYFAYCESHKGKKGVSLWTAYLWSWQFAKEHNKEAKRLANAQRAVSQQKRENKK